MIDFIAHWIFTFVGGLLISTQLFGINLSVDTNEVIASHIFSSFIVVTAIRYMRRHRNTLKS